MTADDQFDHYYEIGLSRGRSHRGAFIYAAQKYIETVFDRRHLIHDDDLEHELAEDGFHMYGKAISGGLSHFDAWSKVSKWIRRMITEMEDSTPPSGKRPAGAFEEFDDMADALPPRGAAKEQKHWRPKAREPEAAQPEHRGSLYEEDMRRRAHARPQPVPRVSPPRPQPPMPAGQGRYHFPGPEYPEHPWCNDFPNRPFPPMPMPRMGHHFPPPMFPSDPFGDDFFNRAPPFMPYPPMPAGHGKYQFPEPEYPNSAGARPQPRYAPESDDYEHRRGYNAREFRPNGARSPSPRRESSRGPARPRYETREPTSPPRESLATSIGSLAMSTGSLAMSNGRLATSIESPKIHPVPSLATSTESLETLPARVRAPRLDLVARHQSIAATPSPPCVSTPCLG
jgi:hypothetical protein